VALRGRYSPTQARTEGCAAVVGVRSEVVPNDIGELNAAVSASTLIHLSCHGIFDWAAPLSSHLQLGFDLSVADLFDRLALPSESLVMLGTCDSGTVAQTDLNEGIGMPAGLLAAGASTVVGAGWPVAQVAAVGVCRKLFEAIGAGQASPEALRAASNWLRSASGTDLLELFQRIGHPLAAQLVAQSPRFLASRPFADPWVWAAYLHWGTPWRATGPEA